MLRMLTGAGRCWYDPDVVDRWDVIVVGAGAVGSAALRGAAEAGARVLGIEQHTPANLRGSSHGHSRIFRHAYFEHPDYVPLLRHATARFESLEREAATPLLHRCGMLVMGPRGSEVVGGSLDSAHRWGLAVDGLDAGALRARFPWFAVPDDTIGCYEANAGLVRPEATVHAAVRVASGHGAELRTTTRVRVIVEDDSGVAVVTDHGTERAAAVIVAAGAWAGHLLPEIAPLLAVTRQVQAWFAPSPGTDATAMPCWLYDRGPREKAVYGLAPDPAPAADTPATSAPSRCPKVAIHGSDEVIDPDVGARVVDAADIERVRGPYRSLAPSLAGELVATATCLYTMSPDEHFLVGTRPNSSRVHFAAGLSGHGFKLAPAIGDALRDLALHGRTDLPVGFLSPERFAL
jgi:monomeric sarcosine oxidase